MRHHWMPHSLYMQTFSEVLALAFDKVFAFYCLAVKNYVCECIYPVAKKYATRTVTQSHIHINMAMTKDEAVDRGMLLKVFTCKDYAMLLLLAKIWRIALLLVFLHAMLRPFMSHPQTPTWMNH